MSDDSKHDFNARLRAHEAARAKGQRSKSGGGAGRRRSQGGGMVQRLTGIVMILAVLVLLKSALYFLAGPSAYGSKLMAMTASSAVHERAIAFVMRPDPATKIVTGFFAKVAFWVNSAKSSL